MLSLAITGFSTGLNKYQTHAWPEDIELQVQQKKLVKKNKTVHEQMSFNQKQRRVSPRSLPSPRSLERRNEEPDVHGLAHVQARLKEMGLKENFDNSKKTKSSRNLLHSLTDDGYECSSRGELGKQINCIVGEDGKNSCIIEGVQVSIMHGTGITWCKDCLDAHEVRTLLLFLSV